MKADCIALLQQLDSEYLWRALWLLRRSAEEAPLTGEDLERITEAVDEPMHWLTRLCLCQLLATTGCPESLRGAVAPMLCRSFEDRRVIVRAWALSALWTFVEDPLHGRRIRALRRVAAKDSQKSMQARLRHLK